MEEPEISFVIPLYNEQDTFPNLCQRLEAVMASLPYRFEVVLVNDGSRDATESLMAQKAYQDPRYTCVFLSRNHGHQLALSAGLQAAHGSKAIMVLDGDLQDPPELLADFVAQLDKGFDVVYAVRKKRKENWTKKLAYKLFYRVMKQISYIEMPLDSGDFALLSRRVVDVLNLMPEENRFLRGMRSWVGFKQIGLEYERDRRFAGQTKYTFKKLVRLAYMGIFNFSEFPIKFITNLGLFTVLISVVYLLLTIFFKLYYHNVPPGFTTLLFAIILFSGVQLISLGVIGEYVLRIFFQVKGRPLFVVKHCIYRGKNYASLEQTNSEKLG
jgi:dolichol-phosphate mannosyltransferase